MNSIASWLDSWDKGLFSALRRWLHSDFMEHNSGLLGDVYAWVPMFVFLAIVVYLGRPGSGVFSIFFGLASFILSFQAAMLLAKMLDQPTPVKYEFLMHAVELPGYGRALGLGLPDWGVAGMVAVFHFTRLRLRQFGEPSIVVGWIPIVVFAVLRIYAGYTYPMGVLMAILIGVLIAWLMFKLAGSVEMLSPTLTNSESDKDQRES